jgi:hypothetical protein
VYRDRLEKEAMMTFQHRSSRVARLLVTAVAVGALATPPALASPRIGPVIHDKERDGKTVAPEPAPPGDAAPVVVRAADNGFDWDSAAIGAGGAGALIVLASLGGFAYTSRRGRIPPAP